MIDRKHRGFTLVELLVVIAIIGILVALLLPAIQAARESARRTQCVNHLKQFGLALLNHHDTLKHLPYYRSRHAEDGHTWYVDILPFMEGQNIYDAWIQNDPVAGNQYKPAFFKQPQKVIEFTLPEYFCPSRRRPPLISKDEGRATIKTTGSMGDYAACVHDQAQDWDGTADPTATNGAFPVGQGQNTPKTQPYLKLTSMVDGTSKTIFIGEKHVREIDFGLYPYDNCIFNSDHGQTSGRAAGTRLFKGVPIGAPVPIASGPDEAYNVQFGSWHPQSCNFLMGDGHVDTVSPSIDLLILQRMANRRDGEG